MLNQEIYVSLDTAKLLKNNGFIDPIKTVWYEHLPEFLCYWDDEINQTGIHLYYPIKDSNCCIKYRNNIPKPNYVDGEIYSAPTREYVRDWLEKKGINIYIFTVGTKIEKVSSMCKYIDVKLDWKYRIFYDKSKQYEDAHNFKTYEEALEEGIKYALQNLITEKMEK